MNWPLFSQRMYLASYTGEPGEWDQRGKALEATVLKNRGNYNRCYLNV